MFNNNYTNQNSFNTNDKPKEDEVAITTNETVSEVKVESIAIPKDTAKKSIAERRTKKLIASKKDKLKEKRLELEAKLKAELEKLKEAEKEEAKKIRELERADKELVDKDLVKIVRAFYEKGFSDFNTFKSDIKELLD